MTCAGAAPRSASNATACSSATRATAGGTATASPRTRAKGTSDCRRRGFVPPAPTTTTCPSRSGARGRQRN
eukprot:7037893-Pyramimonas_sp.AAC.1